MKTVENGITHHEQVTPTDADLASALGNTGVDVVSSPATIAYLERVAMHALEPYYEDDEATVGVGFNFRHLSAAFPGSPVNVTAELIDQKPPLFTFRVEARQNDRIIMTGEHERAVVNLSRFLSKAGA